MGHAITAYLGALKGHKSIASAISDTEIYPVVYGALQESGAALLREHGFTEEEHARYIGIVLARFHNKDVPDVPWRVGREPLRKLKPNDRLVGPTTMCRQMGLNRGHLLRGTIIFILALNCVVHCLLRDRRRSGVQERRRRTSQRTAKPHRSRWA